jgi:multiple sugar transport system substrate-binding protein
VKSSSIELQGITWDHSRALPPLVATSQRFQELHPNIQIHWHKRSLHAFGHANVADLAEQFDIVVIDHPWAGYAIDRNVFLNLFDHLEQSFFQELKVETVGQCAESYLYEGRWLALPIDAASPAASCRPDLLRDSDVPRTWQQLIDLASRSQVILPAFHVDLLLHLVMLAATLNDQALFANDESWCADDVLSEAMDLLAALMTHIPKECYAMNPIAVYESLSQRDEHLYCPFAYTYNNYARDGFAQCRLRFLDPVELPGRGMLRGVLGGTGLAVSISCRHAQSAMQFLRFAVAPESQRTFYTHAGGQPAQRSAWSDPLNNQLTADFFASTTRSIERAYLRPRYNGFIHFQEQAGKPLVQWLQGESTRTTAIDQMNALYRESRGLLKTCTMH